MERMKAVVGFSVSPEQVRVIEDFLKGQYKARLIRSWFSREIEPAPISEGSIVIATICYAVVVYGANPEMDEFCAKFEVLFPNHPAWWAPILDEVFSSTGMLLDLLPEGKIGG